MSDQSADNVGPKYITDLEAIKRRAGDLADQNMRFRSWLKFKCDLDEKELDDLVRATTDEVWKHIECTECGVCCRSLYIVVDSDDVSRIAKHTGVSSSEFMRCRVRNVDGDRVMSQSPCMFLKGNVCTIYADRPKACADFPYLHSGGLSSRMLMMIENSFICPVVFNTLEELKRKLPWRNKRKKRF